MTKFVYFKDVFLAIGLLFIDKCFAEFSDMPSIKLSADVGSNITLPCNKRSPDKIVWIRGGKQRQGDTKILGTGDIILTSLEKTDTGIYECRLEESDNDESDYRNILSRVYLSVKSPPGALNNVTIVPSSVLAFLQWTSVDDGGYPDYNINLQYKDISILNNDTWHEVHPRNVAPNVKQIDIYKLNPNTTYLFQVWATNKLGPGEVTNITVRTLYNNEEIELARHLLDGAETFDTRVWIAAVAVVMVTLFILTIGVCCVLYHEGRMPSQKEVDDDDPEKIELIPNVVLNPNYYEEVSKWKQIHENAHQQQRHDMFEGYYADSTTKPVRV